MNRASNTESLEQLAQRHDHFNMARVIHRLPEQIDVALRDSLPALPKGPFDNVVVAGVGGSALPTDVLNDAFADQLRIPVRVWRHYGLPSSVSESTLVIACSFSGSTEETLSAIEDLPSLAPNVVVITAGGRLSELAKERRYPLILLPVQGEPKGFQPRSAFGYIVTYMARVLHAVGFLSDPVPMLERARGFLRETDVRPPADETALWLGDRIPVVYTDEIHHMSVARITKIKFNENSKRPAFFNAYPELNHNEMIGFNAKLGEFGVLYLHDPSSHPRVQQRFKVMERAFAEEGLQHVAFREWVMPGSSRIERVFSALMFADWCSYTLALLSGIDPTPVDLVEHFKQLLGGTKN